MLFCFLGQPYAGGSGNRTGSAPLRKYKSAAPAPTGNIRGSGAIANRSVSNRWIDTSINNIDRFLVVTDFNQFSPY